MTLAEIDFARLYRDQVAQSGRPRREPAYWDRRAAAMSGSTFQSSYTASFLDRLDLNGCRTLLDVGCGPGTIGLSVADRLDRVYGLDYSPAMLAAFVAQAGQRGVTNATALQRAWEDDWSDVPVCDVVVASRATAVSDFEAAARKMIDKAARRVYLTYPARGRFVGDEACRAIGRSREPLPDYLCVVGILHHLGVHPRLDYLDEPGRFATCLDPEAFVRKMGDYAGDLGEQEIDILREYFARHQARLAAERMRWAFIWWEVEPAA